MNSCPADETLELLLADAVAGPELDAVDSHLADCDSCQLRLERMLAAGAATLPNSPSSEMSSPTGWDEARRRRMASFVHEAASAEPDASGAELPKTIGDFELVEVIGTGGMGVVYRGRQTTLKRPVAVKMISQSHFGNPTLVRRFQVEAEAAARLNHPGIVPVYAVGESGPYVFMAMEL